MKLRFVFQTVFCALVMVTTGGLAQAADRRAQVLDDRTEVGAMEEWIYNDLPKATAEAEQSGKPLLMVIRCVP